MALREWLGLRYLIPFGVRPKHPRLPLRSRRPHLTPVSAVVLVVAFVFMGVSVVEVSRAQGPKITKAVKQVVSQVTASKPLQFQPWKTAQEMAAKASIELKGRELINNFNVVATQGGKPAVFRGGGFTPMSLNWLIRNQGVRTIVDLRGNSQNDYNDDLIVHSDTIKSTLTEKNQLSQLQNLSPEETEAYINELNAKSRLGVKYIKMAAVDKSLLGLLKQASAQRPLAMFCQWGVNRSGTAWARWASAMGWPPEKAYAYFGVYDAQGKLVNQKDIDYGYRVQDVIKNGGTIPVTQVSSVHKTIEKPASAPISTSTDKANAAQSGVTAVMPPTPANPGAPDPNFQGEGSRNPDFFTQQPTN